MQQAISDTVDRCAHCKQTKSPHNKAKNPGLYGEFKLVEALFETLHIDYVGPLPRSEKHNYKYILTAIDRFSNYVFAVPVKEKDAESTCAALIDHVFCYTGVPKNVYSDRGSEFTIDLWARLSTAWGFK